MGSNPDSTARRLPAASALAHALDGAPYWLTVEEIAEAVGRSDMTVYRWARDFSDFPKVDAPAAGNRWGGTGRPALRKRPEMTAWLRKHADELTGVVGSIPAGDPDELVSMAQIAERLGKPAGTVSAWPAMYRMRDDPFPEAAAEKGKRRWGEVAAWLARRGDRQGAGGPKGKGVSASPDLPV